MAKEQAQREFDRMLEAERRGRRGRRRGLVGVMGLREEVGQEGVVVVEKAVGIASGRGGGGEEVVVVDRNVASGKGWSTWIGVEESCTYQTPVGRLLYSTKVSRGYMAGLCVQRIKVKSST